MSNGYAIRDGCAAWQPARASPDQSGTRLRLLNLKQLPKLAGVAEEWRGVLISALYYDLRTGQPTLIEHEN